MYTNSNYNKIIIFLKKKLVLDEKNKKKRKTLLVAKTEGKEITSTPGYSTQQSYHSK
jgi:hypothetical protein